MSLDHNAVGQFSKIIRTSGAETETATSVYSYFNGGAFKLIDHWHSGPALASTAPTSLGSSISSYQWTYDAAGRVDQFTAPEGVFDYGYDNTHQLTSAVFTIASGYTGGTPASESFDFDLAGNRNSQTVGGSTTTTTVDKNRLLSDGTYNYAYDAEGSRISRTLLVNGSPTGETINYTWDHRNRLVKAEFRGTPGGTLTKIVVNSYDAFDRRVMKQVDANADGDFADSGDRIERYVWDGDDLILVLDANGAVLHRFLHGPAIDQIFADESSVDGLLWYLTDNQGTTRDVINNSGTVVNHLTYSSFGKLTSESDPTKTPFVGYTAQDLDEDLGLQLHGKRWFDPFTGRWMSEDPIRFSAGDVNLQRYVQNQPSNAIDINGQEPQWHHMLPKQFIKEFALSGIDINDPQWGWIIEREFHTGKGGLHPRWNEEWERFFDNYKGRRAPLADILCQLNSMKTSKQFVNILKKGQQATTRYDDWLKVASELREAAYATKATGGSKTVRILKKVGQITKVVAIATFVWNASTKSVEAAVVEAEQDALWPYSDLATGAAAEASSVTDELFRGANLNRQRRNDTQRRLIEDPRNAPIPGRANR